MYNLVNIFFLGDENMKICERCKRILAREGISLCDSCYKIHNEIYGVSTASNEKPIQKKK